MGGLHLRSGVARDQLAELHGNCNTERCDKCGTMYERDYDVVARQGTSKPLSAKHATGRRCDATQCSGALFDTIVSFGEDLPQRDIELALDYASKADLLYVFKIKLCCFIEK